MTGVDPQALFDWYPIERLVKLEQHYEPWIHGTPYTYVRQRRHWNAYVQRLLNRGTAWERWSEPDEVDLTNVEPEMQRVDVDGAVFRVWASETEGEVYERIRGEINAAVQRLAAKTEPLRGQRGFRRVP